MEAGLNTPSYLFPRHLVPGGWGQSGHWQALLANIDALVVKITFSLWVPTRIMKPEEGVRTDKVEASKVFHALL